MMNLSGFHCHGCTLFDSPPLRVLHLAAHVELYLCLELPLEPRVQLLQSLLQLLVLLLEERVQSFRIIKRLFFLQHVRGEVGLDLLLQGDILDYQSIVLLSKTGLLRVIHGSAGIFLPLEMKFFLQLAHLGGEILILSCVEGFFRSVALDTCFRVLELERDLL